MSVKKQVAKSSQSSDVPGQAQIAFGQVAIRSGPLPDPHTLAEYERLLTNSANRIFLMAEKDQQFNHTFQLREQAMRARTMFFGQIFGFLLGLAALAAAILLSFNGKSLSGAAIFLGAVATLIATAVWSHQVPQKKQ